MTSQLPIVKKYPRNSDIEPRPVGIEFIGIEKIRSRFKSTRDSSLEGFAGSLSCRKSKAQTLLYKIMYI